MNVQSDLSLHWVHMQSYRKCSAQAQISKSSCIFSYIMAYLTIKFTDKWSTTISGTSIYAAFKVSCTEHIPGDIFIKIPTCTVR